ncbi:DUF167 family protein [Nocardioides carbamazepini]|uniref:DUF167 family protein n=1 Tax=Nocardioides carbamazepini TaxID=2854259 RepID=UPI003557B439
MPWGTGAQCGHARRGPGHPEGARHARGGRYGAENPPVLAVGVTAPAIDGKANAAVVAALAAALGVPARVV